MAEHEEPSEAEQIEVKPRDSPSSLEFDSGTEEERPEPSASAEKAKVFRLFGREKPVHHVLGGGQDLRLTFQREIALGRGLKKFIIVIAGLYLLSIVGTSLNFLTLLYLLFLALHTVPVLYEKYEDKLDAYAEKGMFELKKRYALFDAKVMSKIPRLPLKEKKMH